MHGPVVAYGSRAGHSPCPRPGRRRRAVRGIHRRSILHAPADSAPGPVRPDPVISPVLPGRRLPARSGLFRSGGRYGEGEPGGVGGRTDPDTPPGGIPLNREEIIMLIHHTVPGNEAEAKDAEAGTPGDSPEAALAEVGLDPFSIRQLLSAEPGAFEDR